MACSWAAMPSAEQDQLLGAIRDQPEDDTARLAYADWLDENGDGERAEFVRIQCRLAALGHGPMSPHAGSASATRAERKQRFIVRLLLSTWKPVFRCASS